MSDALEELETAVDDWQDRAVRRGKELRAAEARIAELEALTQPFTESELARAVEALGVALVRQDVDLVDYNAWLRSTVKKVADALTEDWPDGVTVIKPDAAKRIEELEGEAESLRMALARGWTFAQYEWAQAHPDEAATPVEWDQT